MFYNKYYECKVFGIVWERIQNVICDSTPALFTCIYIVLKSYIIILQAGLLYIHNYL